MRFDVITLFPEMMQALATGVIGRAQQIGIIDLHCWNPRDYTLDVHKTVVDRPYGGGPGMVMKVEPLDAAIKDAKQSVPSAKVIYLSPQGQPLTQSLVSDLSKQSSLILLSGRYEGIDERLLLKHVDMEISIGDYVLSGGELPAMVLIDAVSRLLPGVLGHEESAVQDSHVNGLLDCQHYTRPEVYKDKQVPEVLLSGNHEKIRQWRLKQSLALTRAKRPDLLAARSLTKEEARLLKEIEQEQASS